jgi:hypothetical protein
LEVGSAWSYTFATELTCFTLSSVGVQIGHESSAAGIVGTWTGANHDEGE